MKDLDQRLRAAGETPVPPPDPAFAARLEERLRAGVLAPEPILRPARPVRPAARRWYPAVAMAAALAAVVGVVGVLRDSGPGTVRVTSPASTPPPVGWPEPTTTTVTTPAPKAAVTTSTTKPAVTTSTVKPTTRSTTKPTTESTTKTTTKPVTAPVEPKPTTTTSAPAGPATLRLESRYKDTTAKLQWSGYAGKDFAAYLVLRADGPAEPTYPADGATTVVATITSQWSVSFMETISDPPGRRYRVVAVDSERRLIAASPAVTPQPFA